MTGRAASTVLVLDDDPRVLSALGRSDLGEPFELRLCSRSAEALAVAGDIEVALVDQHLAPGDPTGLEVLAQLRDRDPDCFRIIFTGAADLAFAVNAINQGLIDAFLVKPWTEEAVKTLLGQGCETALLRRHNRQLSQELSERNSELENLNRQLESLVEHRTRDLRETLERLKNQQQELIRLETQASISQMVRGLAHELNNPLASILGYSQRLRRRFAEDAETAPRLDIIIQEVGRCSSLVEQLRNFSQPLSEAVVSCRPDELMRQAIQRLVAMSRPPPEVTIDKNLPRVQAAPRSMVRVYEQILDNARLAGATGCTLSAQTRHSRVRLVLTNDGTTPDEETLRHATRPFFTTRADRGHRGLGLAMANSLLREQGGHVELERRTDGLPGIACVVTLPLVEVEEEAAVIPSSERTRSRAAVLVVDDEPLVAELLVDSLAEAQVDSVRVGSVEEAMKVSRSRPLRAVLVDLNLPDGNGIELVRRLVQVQPGLTGHVAVITGSSDPEALAQLRAQADLPILGKPFHLNEIQRLMRDIL